MSPAPLLVPVFLAAVALLAIQESPDDDVVARVDRYLAAYAGEDFDALGGLLAADARFEDGAQELDGRDAIVAGLTSIFEGLTIDTLELDERIRSGDQHVLCSGRVTFRLDAAGLGLAGREFAFDLPMSIALKFDAEGLVVRHVDYVDSAAFAEQVQSQLPADVEDEDDDEDDGGEGG